MNDPESSPINLDELRLMPAWLREGDAAPAERYASHNYPLEGERENRRGGPGGGGRRDFGGAGGGSRERSGGGGGGNRSGGGPSSGPRRSGPNDRGPRPAGGPSRGGPGPRGGDRRDDRRSDDRRPPAPPREPVVAAPVGIQFLPDDRCMESIVKQIRTSHLAYPLFGLARMFLQEPARHWLEISVLPAALETGAKLYQLGEGGPVAVDRATLEKIGFEAAKDQFYVEETVQKDPPKGNFTSVARCRLSGTLLGPTNYHGYQPALRALYERRFSRQMSFEDYRRNIEVVSDPALVEKWKEDVRTVKTIKTIAGDPPSVLNSPTEARVHFRQHHFEAMVREGTSFRLPGSVACNLPEPGMMQAIRQAHEPELRYPGRFVQLLREALQNSGLHIFKHRKRFVYVAASRPATFSGSEVLTESVAAILKLVGENPLITRKALGDKILAGIPEAAADAPPEDPFVKARAALLADLRFLVQSGHLIEFHNGTFDLPLPPKPKAPPAAAGESASTASIEGEAAISPEAGVPKESAAPEVAEVNPESVVGDQPASAEAAVAPVMPMAEIEPEAPAAETVSEPPVADEGARVSPEAAATDPESVKVDPAEEVVAVGAEESSEDAVAPTSAGEEPEPAAATAEANTLVEPY